MTRLIDGPELAARLRAAFPEAIRKVQPGWVVIAGEALLPVMAHLKERPELAFDMLVAETAVDYEAHFELIYQLTSIRHNHCAVVKTRIENKVEPEVDSLISLWQSADFQEREIWDLMGIRFRGHPTMKRILTWEGFPGHPLRKDFLWVERQGEPLLEM